MPTTIVPTGLRTSVLRSPVGRVRRKYHKQHIGLCRGTVGIQFTNLLNVSRCNPKSDWSRNAMTRGENMAYAMVIPWSSHEHTRLQLLYHECDHIRLWLIQLFHGIFHGLTRLPAWYKNIPRITIIFQPYWRVFKNNHGIME